MASAKSLGLAKPPSLQYLIDEGLISADKTQHDFEWRFATDLPVPDKQSADELLITKSCVVWSRYGLTQRVLNFDVEKESVTTALFVSFPQDAAEKRDSPLPDGAGSGSLKFTDADRLVQVGRKQISTGQARPEERLTKSYRSSAAKAQRFLPGSSESSRNRRALVVLLKTQAHVHYLLGDTHVVNLPFEVEGAFATPFGLVLQRKTTPKQSTPSFRFPPKTPTNTFSVSLLDSFKSPPSSSGAEDEPPLLTNMFRSLLSTAQHSSGGRLPSHVYLRDPLTELGTVGELEEHDPSTSSRSGVKYSAGSQLSSSERILYMSAYHELSGRGKDQPVLLALSFNTASGQYTVWKVVETPERLASQAKRRTWPGSGISTARRRSSHGAGTGTTTPALRASLNPRESFGVSKDVQSELPRNDDELETHLGPAFDNLPKSSRRISSLLARVEPAGTLESLTFSEPGRGAGVGIGQRKGPSIGQSMLRTSFGANASTSTTDGGLPKARHKAYLKDHGLKDDSSDASEDTEMLEALDNKKSSLKKTALHSLQHDVGLVKIHSFHPLQIDARAGAAPIMGVAEISVFTIESSGNSSQNFRDLVLCIFHSQVKQLLVVTLTIPLNATPSVTVPDIENQGVQVRIKNVQIARGVINVCKIRDGRRPRIIILTESEDGYGRLVLQSPGEVPISVQLPLKYLIRDPFNCEHQASRPRYKNGGLKRVLSDGISGLGGLRSCAVENQFDLQDSKGVWHRLEIDLSPKDSFVTRALDICQFALLSSSGERDPIFKMWYEIKLWLENRHGDPSKLEWTAFTVTIFSLFSAFLRERPRQAVTRSKRKRGLLRSSSGANLDTESFDAMMLREDKLGTMMPPWMSSGSWRWAVEKLPPATTAGPDSIADNNFPKKILFLSDCLASSREFLASEAGRAAVGEKGYLMITGATSKDKAVSSLAVILVALHLLREEMKLNILCSEQVHSLTPILAQMGGWLGCDEWSWKETFYYSLESSEFDHWTFNELQIEHTASSRPQGAPPSILAYAEGIFNGDVLGPFPSLLNLARSSDTIYAPCVESWTPRTRVLLDILAVQGDHPAKFVDNLLRLGCDVPMLESFPEGIAALIRSLIAACQASPDMKLSHEALTLIDRKDMAMLQQQTQLARPQHRPLESVHHDALRDYHTICNTASDVDQAVAYDYGSAEYDRQAVTRLVFKDDQRFSEAAKLVHPLRPAVARCVPEPEWSDTDFLEAQQEMAKVVAIRTLSVSPGRGMLFYNARCPLLTEKFPIHGFTLSCIMKPANTTVTADKNSYSEEKVSWAFFHAGVEAGLSISKGAKGIETSWILFNRPRELGDRHAGFLLALGLNGHLKSIAKWVAFKYLTTRHTMTSIGLLLGLAASYLGTMDTLITRLLSVHVTRMLPPGAAELNLSPLTQTTGIMALGLLYCNTQHRRMSEVMLSEMENVDQDENTNPLESLRGEGYRLAAGFALGYINLAQGKRLRGLHDMRIVERLLALAVATKKVDIVHILDKATAAATIAIALIFLKTENAALAKKIDVPDTIHQFEYVRPDIFLLRTVARHLIMWKDITPTVAWMQMQLPAPFRTQAKLSQIRALRTEDLPLYNIIAGLCLSVGFRFAGSARQDVRDLLGIYLDQFMRINRLPALHYDAKLTRITTRNCQDVIALAAASVMAGTGDIYLLRRFRALHGRCDAETPYGSHLAAHQAIGTLFLGGGTHTFNTSNIAVASLLCAFYPLFPTNVQDCRSHLPAFRHLWVFAAEPRCIIVRSAETQKPLSIPITIVLRSGKELDSTAPCLLPELDSIAGIHSNDPQCWRVTLDFAGNPEHLVAFKRHQSMFVRRRGPYDAHSSVFAATMQALNNKQTLNQMSRQAFEWIFDLACFSTFDRAEKALILPAETSAMLHLLGGTTVVDDRLALERECVNSGKAERLWNLRVLFAWADMAQRNEGKMAWLGKEAIESLRARVGLMWQKESQGTFP